MPLNDPAVSVIIAARDPHPGWLREAVNSALAQVGCSVEVIVVDDGSPKPVADLLEGFADERLRLLRISHSGVSSARNQGVSASRGAFLRFLDDDDVLPPKSTRQLLDLASGDEEMIAVGATRWCRENLDPIYDLAAGCPRKATEACLLLRCTPTLPSVLFPRRVVQATGEWEPTLRVSEDWDFLLRAMEHAPVAETKEPVAWYRQHPGSASRDLRESWRGTVAAARRYFERHPDERGTPLERKVDAMLDLFRTELSRRHSAWRTPAYWRALRRDPSALRTVWVRQAQPRLARARMLLRRPRA